MEINAPDVLAEVTQIFASYEKALVTNDIETLDTLFWDSPLVLRYGTAENLYGIEAIRAFRSARSPVGLAREISNTVITPFGRDMATANTEFHRRESGVSGRQSQTWVRLDGAWRIVSAHVSLLK